MGISTIHALRYNCTSLTRHAIPRTPTILNRTRRLHTETVFESKYAEKLRKLADQKGLSIAELKAKAKEEAEKEKVRQRELSKTLTASKATSHSPAPPGQSAKTEASRDGHVPVKSVRKDSSPVKPLSSILNIPRILATPHTSAQISALWTAYHVSRSNGTGRGYICATIPLDLYNKMASVASKFSSFVVPLPRLKDPAAPDIEGEEKTAYEFYFLQWAFHHVPPVPSAAEPDPFVPPPTVAPTGTNPQISTILFTPLQEYKLRQSFATPYLVLTHYTDLAHTHGVVLMRGEITPSAAGLGPGVDGRYMLNQADAQLLSMGVQKFYLWSNGNGQEREGERLLKSFHEKPEDFKWEELLKHASWTI